MDLKQPLWGFVARSARRWNARDEAQNAMKKKKKSTRIMSRLSRWPFPLTLSFAFCLAKGSLSTTSPQLLLVLFCFLPLLLSPFHPFSYCIWLPLSGEITTTPEIWRHEKYLLIETSQIFKSQIAKQFARSRMLHTWCMSLKQTTRSDELDRVLILTSYVQADVDVDCDQPFTYKCEKYVTL